MSFEDEVDDVTIPHETYVKMEAELKMLRAMVDLLNLKLERAGTELERCFQRNKANTALSRKHWIYQTAPVPMPLYSNITVKKEVVVEAAKYAFRQATHNGTQELHPDLLIDHLLTALLGVAVPYPR